MVGGRVRADLFILADIFVKWSVGAHQRPDLLLLRLADIEKPGPDRREEPLVQTAAVVVALEIVTLKWEVGEAMSAVDEDLDALLPAQPHHLAHWQDLAGQVRDLRELN